MVSVASRFLSFAALAAVLYGVPADAQTGRITGVVRDARGAGLSGATIRAVNQGTGASRRTTTAADGRYTVSDLAPGVYTVSASLPGVRTVTQKDVQVAAAREATVDFELQPLVLEAITVTAMLREQRLADVPFSIAAPTEQVLRLRGADNIEAIATNVAGFSVQNLGPGQSQVAMRGASSGQIARDQPGVKEQVGSYLDDVPVSLSLFTPDLDLFDVSRVEVLRGPQGTLFGAGSLSGTVRYISNQPELGVSSIFGEVGASFVDGGSAGISQKLGYNAPLGDKWAFRVVGYANRIPGYMDAVQPDRSVDDDVNSGGRNGVRAAVRFAPHERFSITPRVVYQRVKMDGWNRIDDFNILATPFTTTRPAVRLGDRQLFTQIEEPYTDEFLLADVNLRHEFAGLTLTTIGSYTFRDVLVVRDAGALTSSITGGSIGLPENIYTLDSPLDDATTAKVWTQEVRLSGARDRLRWVVGGFYSNSQRKYGQSLIVSRFDQLAAPILGAPPGFTRGLRAGLDELFFSDLSYDLKQIALFGEATVSVSPQLDLTGGLRYYNFDERRDQIFDGIFAHDSTGITVASQPGATEADGVAPRFIVSFKATDDLTINALASRGVRLGGINDPLNVPLCTPEDLVTFGGRNTWKDETAWNYEVGVKSRLAGGRASLNLSAFYMDIRDLQLTVTAGTCSSRLIFNVDKARTRGTEVELTATPTEGLDFSVSAGVNDSELRSTIRSAGQPVSGMAAGNRLPSVPRVQGTAAATYQWDVGAGSRMFLTGSYQHVGSRFTAIDDHGRGQCWPSSLPNCPFGTVALTTFQNSGGATIGGPLTDTLFTFNPELPAYNLVNVRAGLIRDTWELAFFVANVTDERAFLALDRERGTRARVGYLTNQPRTGGVTLRFNY
ncbi:MAG TPA: TonB-dependent receptor [Gemmatimonadales bacterium]|nr:TonB-dependent receptor [Gemmatimonadales bacterium]